MPTPDFITEAATASLSGGRDLLHLAARPAGAAPGAADYAARLYGGPAVARALLRHGLGHAGDPDLPRGARRRGRRGDLSRSRLAELRRGRGLAARRPREVALDWTDAGWQLDLDRLQDAVGAEDARDLRQHAGAIRRAGRPTGRRSARSSTSPASTASRSSPTRSTAASTTRRPGAPSFHDVMEDGRPDPLRQLLLQELGDDRLARRLDRDRPGRSAASIENLIQYSTSGVAAFMQRGAIAAIDQGRGLRREPDRPGAPGARHLRRAPHRRPTASQMTSAGRAPSTPSSRSTGWRIRARPPSASSTRPGRPRARHRLRALAGPRFIGPASIAGSTRWRWRPTAWRTGSRRRCKGRGGRDAWPPVRARAPLRRCLSDARVSPLRVQRHDAGASCAAVLQPGSSRSPSAEAARRASSVSVSNRRLRPLLSRK